MKWVNYTDKNQTIPVKAPASEETACKVYSKTRLASLLKASVFPALAAGNYKIQTHGGMKIAIQEGKPD